jgi:hypothetical protein
MLFTFEMKPVFLPREVNRTQVFKIMYRATATVSNIAAHHFIQFGVVGSFPQDLNGS